MGQRVVQLPRQPVALPADAQLLERRRVLLQLFIGFSLLGVGLRQGRALLSLHGDERSGHIPGQQHHDPLEHKPADRHRPRHVGRPGGHQRLVDG